MQSDPSFEGKISYLNARATSPRPHVACLSVRIDNFAHIRRAYGTPTAEAALAHLRASIAECMCEPLELIDQPDGSITAYVGASRNLGEINPAWASDRLTGILSFIPLMAFQSEAGPIHLALSGSWEIPSVPGAAGDPGRSGTNLGKFCGMPPGSDEHWARAYRADMTSCAEILGAIADGAFGYSGFGMGMAERDQLAFAWESVVDAGGTSSLLYIDARPVLIDRSGAKRDLTGHRHALERLGLATTIDHFFIEAVFHELQEDPDVVLSVNISAQSVGQTMWWDRILLRIGLDRSVSRRLIVTMSEAAQIPDMSSAAELVRRIQRMGVKFAVDNFGLGFASIREIIALSPDIARIDPFFLQWRGREGAANATLRDLARFARSLAPIVVIGGISGEDERRTALGAGLRWQQGRAWGEPSCVRPWRTSPGATCNLLNLLRRAEDTQGVTH